MQSISSSLPYCPAPALLPALARPPAPASPAPGKACPAWSSPWSPCRPVKATSLVRGAWWNSLLLFSRMSAWLELILTDSFTCLFKQLLKLPSAVIVKTTFSPPCSNALCVKPLRNLEIKNLPKWWPWLPFSQARIISDENIWMLSPFQFRFQFIFGYELKTVFCSSKNG